MEQQPPDKKRPTVAEIEKEIKRRQVIKATRSVILSGARILIVFAAVAVLISTLWLPVIRVQQSSMTPTLEDGDSLLFVKTGTVERGDIIAFHYDDQVLVKRVIAIGGDKIDIDYNGVVSLNGETLNEPYISAPNLGNPTVDLPLQVPAGQLFVMGDNRATSVDSRIKEMGPIHEDRLIGKALLRIWPLWRLGTP